MSPFQRKPIYTPEDAILGVDFGKKVVGLSYFKPGEDENPYPYGRIVYESDEQVIRELGKVIKIEKIVSVVIGLPLYPDGKQSKMSDRVIVFAQALKAGLPEITLYSQDESGSTEEAKRLMGASSQYNCTVDMKKIDQVSACVILQRFLNEFKEKSS